jgi:hypothetical protein
MIGLWIWRVAKVDLLARLTKPLRPAAEQMERVGRWAKEGLAAVAGSSSSS